MIYELRIYRCVPKRLPALLKRFETVTLAMFSKHGIRHAGFWTVEVGPHMSTDLYYLLAWESMGEREQRWNAFQADPDWIAARARSEEDGAIIAELHNSFLKPTAFSALT